MQDAASRADDDHCEDRFTDPHGPGKVLGVVGNEQADCSKERDEVD